MFDELKEVKYIKKVTDLESYNVKHFNKIKRLKSLQKKRRIRTQTSIYDRAFFVNILNGLLLFFSKKLPS